MNSDTVYIGQLKRLVELFKLTTTTNASAEAQKTPVSLGKKFVKRNIIDVLTASGQMIFTN